MTLAEIMRGQLHEFLGRLYAAGLAPAEIAVEAFQDASFEVYLSLVPRARAASEPQAATSDPRLRRVHRRLLQAAGAAPTPAKQLASRAGFRRCGSYVRTALTELARWGLLVRTPDGYRLAQPDHTASFTPR